MHPSLRLARREVDGELRFVCTAASEDACEWFGVPPSELVGRSIRDISAALAGAILRPDASRGPGALEAVERVIRLTADEPPRTIRVTVIHEGDSTLLTWSEIDAALHDAETLRGLFESSIDMLLITDRSGKLIRISRSMSEMLGDSVDELRSQPFINFVHPDDRAQTLAVFEAMFASQMRVTNFENRYMTRSGSYRWLRWTASPPDPSGLIYASARDVSAPKLLDKQRALSFASLDSTKFGVVMTDGHGALEWCNHGFTQMCGYSISELAGRRLGALLQGPRTDEREATRVRQAVHEGVAFQTELLNYHASGRTYWVRIEAEPIHDEHGVRHYLAIEVDVTEDRLRAAALAGSEARLRATLTASQDAIYWLAPCRDADGEIADFEITDANPAAEAELGIARELLLGRRINALHPIDGTGGSFASYTRVFETGATFDQEFELARGHTAPRFYHQSVLRVGEELVIFKRDLTHQKIREADQRRALRLSALGRLASGIAHDFNNALAGIGFSAELLQRQLHDQQALAIVTDIAASTRRAGQFAKQILMFSRPSEGTLQPHLLDQACGETLDMLGRSIPATVALHVELEPDLKVRADPIQIRQVLTNLVANASQALPSAGGNIWVTIGSVPTAELPDALALARPVERCALIEVRDDGVGIPEDELELVFDPFFSTKAPELGSGLGLSIVHGIVAGHDGRVTVDSVVDEGTTFRITLPLLADEVPLAEYEASDAPEPELPAELGVLLVDDDTLIAESLGRVLEKRGYRVFLSDSGESAEQVFTDHCKVISAAVLDLNMPGISGLELGKQLRETRPDLTILLMTGGGSPLPPDELRDAGIAKVLQKPFSSRQLVHEIGALLRN